MKTAQEKAKELLTKELGREPTAEEINKLIVWSDRLKVNGILKDAEGSREVFEDYSKPEINNLD